MTSTPTSDRTGDEGAPRVDASTTSFGKFVAPVAGTRPTVPQQRTQKAAKLPRVTVRQGRDALQSPSAKWLHDHRHGMLGLILALPAYCRPFWWLIGAVVVLLLLHTVRLLKPAVAGPLSPAALIVLPVRAALSCVGAVPPALGEVLALLVRAAFCLVLAVVAAAGTGLLHSKTQSSTVDCSQAFEYVGRWAVPLGAFVAAGGFVAARLKRASGATGTGSLKGWPNLGSASEGTLLGLGAILLTGAFLAHHTGWSLDMPQALRDLSDWPRWQAEIVARVQEVVTSAACQS